MSDEAVFKFVFQDEVAPPRERRAPTEEANEKAKTSTDDKPVPKKTPKPPPENDESPAVKPPKPAAPGAEERANENATRETMRKADDAASAIKKAGLLAQTALNGNVTEIATKLVETVGDGLRKAITQSATRQATATASKAAVTPTIPVAPPVGPAPTVAPPIAPATQAAGGAAQGGGTAGAGATAAAGTAASSAAMAATAVAAAVAIVVLEIAAVNKVAKEAMAMAKQLEYISPQIAQARAQAEVAQIQADFRNAGRNGEDFASLVREVGEFKATFSELKGEFLAPIAEQLASVLDVINNVAEHVNPDVIRAVGESFLPALLGPLPLLCSAILRWLKWDKDERQKNKPQQLDNFDQFFALFENDPQLAPFLNRQGVKPLGRIGAAGGMP